MADEPADTDLVFCACGLAKYALEATDGTWVYVCEGCDLTEVRVT